MLFSLSHIYMYAKALFVILLLTLGLAGATLAETDPSLSEVYEAAQAGHLERAQQMMNEDGGGDDDWS